MAALETKDIMSKRASGMPRRPKSPVAKTARAPFLRVTVVPNNRQQDKLCRIGENRETGRQEKTEKVKDSE